MSLTPDEKKIVQDQIEGRTCSHCGSNDLAVDDHGMAEMPEWGVVGAYVRCDNCGHELHKEQ